MPWLAGPQRGSPILESSRSPATRERAQHEPEMPQIGQAQPERPAQQHVRSTEHAGARNLAVAAFERVAA